MQRPLHTGIPRIEHAETRLLALQAVGKPLVVVTVSGGPVAEPFLADPATTHTAWLVPGLRRWLVLV